MVVRAVIVRAIVVGSHIWVGPIATGLSRGKSPVIGIYVSQPGQLVSECAHILRLEDPIPGKLPLETKVRLLVIGSNHALVHVTRVGRRRESRIVEERPGSERVRKQVRLTRSRSGQRTIKEHCVQREMRRIEPDVLVSVVVDAVIHDPETAAYHKLLRTGYVPGKAYTRTEVVPVLVPDVVIAKLESFSGYASIERIGRRTESVSGHCVVTRITGKGINERRGLASEVHVRVKSGLKVVRRSVILPTQSEINCEPVADAPVVGQE